MLLFTQYRCTCLIAISSRAGVSKCEARFETLLRGPTQWCGEIVKGVHQGEMIEIGDVKKARPGPKG